MWLVDGNRNYRVQCELRVQPDGTPEVFLNAEDFQCLREFKNWKAIK